MSTYLVTGSGMTLYYYKDDAPDTSNVPSNLIPNWPPFYAAQITVPPSLNVADFGFFTRTDGTLQTTFKGYPLYTFVNDTAPGQTNGEGLLGLWYVVNPDNFPPAPSPSASASASSTPTSTP